MVRLKRPVSSQRYKYFCELGVNIGENCIIGCGAVVTKDIPDNSIAVGIPARVIKSIDDYYKKTLRLL